MNFNKTPGYPAFVLPCLFIVGLLAGISKSSADASPSVRTPHVIFITWDGVRWQDFFSNRPDSEIAAQQVARSSVRRDRRQWVQQGDVGLDQPILPFFWTQMAPQSLVAGPGYGYPYMRDIHWAHCSLPSYQSIFTGTQAIRCFRNGGWCPALPDQPTFLDRLATVPGFAREDLAVFASWDQIRRGVAQHPERINLNAAFDSPDSLRQGALSLRPGLLARLRQTAQEARANPPEWHDARYDRYTWRMAMDYLREVKPKLLYVSLNDTDDQAHQRNYTGVIEALRANDRGLQELVEFVNSDPEFRENTVIITTTDHGRGEGEGWDDHAFESVSPSAGDVWMFEWTNIPGHNLRALQSQILMTTHAAIRPTIETVFGLNPTRWGQIGFWEAVRVFAAGSFFQDVRNFVDQPLWR